MRYPLRGEGWPMANVAEHSGSPGGGGPFAGDLLDPAALERRLVEARARRARALALKADGPHPPAAEAGAGRAASSRTSVVPMFIAGLAAGAAAVASLAPGLLPTAAPLPQVGIPPAVLAAPAAGGPPTLPHATDRWLPMSPLAGLLAPEDPPWPAPRPPATVAVAASRLRVEAAAPIAGWPRFVDSSGAASIVRTAAQPGPDRPGPRPGHPADDDVGPDRPVAPRPDRPREPGAEEPPDRPLGPGIVDEPDRPPPSRPDPPRGPSTK